MLIRARAAFEVGHYGNQPGINTSENKGRPTEIFSEDQTSEDVLLGSRLHAGGFKGAYLRENLATGEVSTLLYYSSLGDVLEPLKMLVVSLYGPDNYSYCN